MTVLKSGRLLHFYLVLIGPLIAIIFFPGFLEDTEQGATMSTSIYDQIFMAECTWDTSNNGHFDLSEPRVLGEANGLLALMDSNFTTGNSALNGTVEVTRNPNTEFVHEVLRSKYVNDICVGCNHNRGDQPAYSCAWNAVHSQDFNENYIWCEDYKSSKCFKSENREDRGIFCLNYGAEFDQNVFGAHTSSNREKSNGFLKDQSVSQANNICENLSEQALQNELGLICSNVGGISNVGFGSDFSNFTVRCMHENSMNSTIGRPCDGISFNQYDEMEMNGRLLAYNTENVISELLNADMTASIEPLEFEGTRGIATVSLNELDGFDDQMPLIASNKTEIYSDEQSPQKVCLPEKDSDKKLPMKTAGSQLALPNNDGNHEENGSRSERVLVKNDNGTMITLTTGERESSNVKPLACGESEGKGQPAKNLLAERRRRKRLNERLCMLRSVVPTITKMDRTSILRDTIEYTKQLLHQIRSLHGELEPQTEWPAHLRAYEGYFRPAVIDLDQKFVDKSIPKLEVERSGSQDLNIHMTCQTNPTILLSTIGTVESFGFDIEQGIISCYSDFGMQVHCSEIVKDKSMNIRPEDIRLALLQTGGYFGKN